MSEKLQVSRWCKSSERGEVMSLMHSLTLGLVFLPESQGSHLLSMAREGASRTALDEVFGDIVTQLTSEQLLVGTVEQDDSLLDTLRLASSQIRFRGDGLPTLWI